MKSRHFIICAFIVLIGSFIGCETEVAIHSHTFAETWTCDETDHWHEPVCDHDVVSGKKRHLFGEYISDGNATTEVNGTKTRTCSVCEYKDTVADEYSKIHVHIYADAWVSNETNHWHESICGHDVTSKKSEHTFGEYVSDGNATTEADGTKTRTCSVCKYTDIVTDEDSKLHSHTYEKVWTSDRTNHWHESTCGHDVATRKIEHSFGEYVSDGNATAEADGTKTRICSVCNYKDTVMNDGSKIHLHTFVAVWTNDETKHWHESTCGHDEKGGRTDHSWNYEDFRYDSVSGKDLRICTVCNYVDEKNHEHTEDNGTVKKTPTCCVKGVKIFKCTVCSAVTKTEEIGATGLHEEDNGTVTTVPTCVTNGVKTYKCTVCDAVIRTEEIAATGVHIEDSGIVTTVPTCVTKGVIIYKCILCDAVIKIEEVAATGVHTEDSGTVTNPTCVTKGVKNYKCIVCDVFLRTEEITAELYSSPVDAETGEVATQSSTYVYFGVFPKTVLPSDSAVSVDENEIKIMGANIYYKGNDGNYYEKVIAKTNSNSYKYTDESATTNGVERYFKVEPIKWKILTNNYNGKCLLVAEDILIGNVPYYEHSLTRTIDGNTVYPNNYKYSTIRAYLNGKYEEGDTQFKNAYTNKGFLQTAFTSAAQAVIAATTVDNSGKSTTDATGTLTKADGSNPEYPEDYTCAATTDKIFLLSEKEVTTNAYGFTAYNEYGVRNTRIRATTDYAKAKYAEQSTYYWGGGYWFLRSPYYFQGSKSHIVDYEGYTTSGYVSTCCKGVVPALCLSLD